MDLIQQLNKEAEVEKNYPDFRVGDTVRVHVKVKEGNKERIQQFQGICIGRKHGSTNRTFRVRKISGGIEWSVYSLIILRRLKKLKLFNRAKLGERSCSI